MPAVSGPVTDYMPLVEYHQVMRVQLSNYLARHFVHHMASLQLYNFHMLWNSYLLEHPILSLRPVFQIKINQGDSVILL